MTKFLIIDGNSIGCRAAFAIPKSGNDLVSRDGIPTGTLHRFFNMINKIMLQLEPTHIIVCWDTDSNTFRKEIYPEYKANRYKDKESPIDIHIMHKQFGMIRKMLDMLGIKSANVQGYEGDDVVGSFAKMSRADYNYICSGDRDSWQLVNKITSVVFPKSGFTDVDIVTPEYVEEKFGISLDNYIGLKTLQGDTSDNIPGFTGVGPKTAAKMLTQYGSADNIAQLKLDEFTGYNKKVTAQLENWQKQYSLLKTLVTIRTDVNVPYSFEDCEIGLLNWKELKGYMKLLDMNNFVQRIEWGAVYRLRW